ncbi:hypothetical protein O181_093726 [Austropuccinia psidii MF-1]|uniref:Uncharacterized protein n=1 Tax=Austropuccinia psidii MF-1 TaxID=1389203 RepID=A0A9Q3J216_9BASI|nr:hypothetical protein [Austropuccinia psidii MF-1]
MEDARTSTNFQRLARTFDTLIESPEAEITAIPVVRPESFPTGSNRDTPVSVKELEAHGPRKDRRTSEGWTPMSCNGQVQQIKSWLKNQSMLSVDQKKRLAQGKDNSAVEAPQARTSKPQRAIRRASKRQNPSGTSLTHRTIEFPRKGRQPWTMCSIWQEL